jgi:ABC-type lipoprotein export system ATPase subunit
MTHKLSYTGAFLVMSLLRVESTLEFTYDGHPYTYRVPEGFHIGAGEKVCISGVSGSGKSTILTMLAGLRRFSQGKINYTFKNGPPLTLNTKRSAGPSLWGQIGFSFQRPELLTALSVERNMKLSLGDRAEAIGRRLFPESQRTVNGELHSTNEWQDIKHKRPTMLSGGQKLRLGLARAFGKGQSLVILDEPTGALDQDNRNMVADFIKDQSKNIGLLVVAHDADFVASLNVDRTFVISQFQEADRKVRSLALQA